jgi:hypothetical protein
MEAALHAVQPRPFGLRRASPHPTPPGTPDLRARASTLAAALEEVMAQARAQQALPQKAVALPQPMAPDPSANSLARAGLAKLAEVAGMAKPASIALMRRFAGLRVPRPAQHNPLLDAMAQSWRGVFVRTLAYIGAIALLSVAAAELFQSAPVVAAVEPAARPDWTAVTKPHPAFHLALPDIADEPHYAILRHGEGGGRKDILSWGEPGGSGRHVTIEIYRPGSEREDFADPLATIGRLAAGLESALRVRDSHQDSLVLASKFGPIVTADFSFGGDGGGHCVGFARAFEAFRVQISGLSCDRHALIDRGAIACALDRLTLLSAGSDPGIARLFAQAELKRNFCGQRDPILYATPRRSIDAGKPLTGSLRGRMAR